jgi:hypothetical protein
MTISRDDLESKLREIETSVVDTGDEVRSRVSLIVAGVATVVVVLVVWGVMRRRRGRVRVEVYRST